MKIKILGSSSSGNCYIIESSGKKIILELGINFKKLQQSLDFNFDNVVCVCISHSHNDHSKYILEFAKLGIDIYCSPETIQSTGVQRYNVGRKISL